jgi:ATP-dependent Clp protease ATP-binding subunit ClpC
MFSEASSNLQSFYFDDPRLRLTLAGRLLVRVVSYLGYLVLLAAAFTFLMSDLAWLNWLGVLVALFLLDRVIHLREGDRLLSEIPRRGKINIARFITPRAFSVIEHAYDRATLTQQDFFLEVVRQLIATKEIKDGLQRLDLPLPEFRQKLEDLLEESGREKAGFRKDEIPNELQALMQEALAGALQNKQRFIDITDIFSALPKVRCAFVKRLLGTFSLEPDDIAQTMLFGAAKRELARGFWRRLPETLSAVIRGGERGLRHRVINRAWTSRPTPTLDKFSLDLTDAARRYEVGFLVGHEAEYRRMVETLSRPTKPNVLLVGEPGIGKETIVAHLALELTKDNVPPELFDRRLVELRLGELVAGASPEEVQKRIQTIAEEIFMAGNVILYIPEIHNLVKTSGAEYLSAADGLMPILKNDLFPVIGATWPREYKQFIEPRSDFAANFEVIRVEEISEAEAEKILVYDALLLEARTGIFISFGAVKMAVKLAKRHFRNKFLPSSAEELLKSALSGVAGRREKFLGSEEVIKAAEEKINVPIHEATGAEAERLLNLEKIIHERLINQEEAVKAVASALREYRSGLSRKGGPIAGFLFVGPTGVGKTELAKILARVQFGSEAAMVRFDMTEYQDKQSFYRFIGSPDGTISGMLTEAVLHKPYSLILLDEFEKAFPDILNLFLQVLDDGRLTDNLGRTVDFTNTIIIATSNAHSDLINDSLRQGQSMSQIAEYLKARLTDVFRPELLNRFSKVIVFRELNPEEVEKIALLNLLDLAKILEDQGIYLDVDSSAVKQVAKLGYNPAFGARPLRRVIDERVRSPMAEALLRKDFARGDRVRLTFSGEKFNFEVQKE